ncbi:MAG: hypothetical protein P8184_10140 [Calditrichia bacterium]
MLTYVYLIIAICMAIASFIMYQHKNRMLVRALGIIMAYAAAGIALKVLFMLSPPH